MLKSSIILLLVFLLWLVYARKCYAYIANQLQKPEYGYLQIFNSLPSQSRFKLFVVLEVWLLLPVVLYAMFIVLVGLQQRLYMPLVLIISFLLLVNVGATIGHINLLKNTGRTKGAAWRGIGKRKNWSSSYPVLLLEFVARKQLLLWSGFKVFTCGILYLIARNNTSADYDIKTVYLFFSFGILACAVVIHRIRAFEERYLSFYRGAPVILLKRFLQYSFVYSILIVPELITLILLTPVHLHFNDALDFFLSGYSFLLLMNSITFTRDYTMKEFLKVILLFFFVQYIFLVTLNLDALYVLFFSLAISFFCTRYFKYEKLG